MKFGFCLISVISSSSWENDSIFLACQNLRFSHKLNRSKETSPSLFHRDVINISQTLNKHLIKPYCVKLRVKFYPRGKKRKSHCPWNVVRDQGRVRMRWERRWAPWCHRHWELGPPWSSGKQKDTPDSRVEKSLFRCRAETGLEGWDRWPWRGPRQGLAEMSMAWPGAGWGGCFLWPAVGESGTDYSQGAKALGIWVQSAIQYNGHSSVLPICGF